MFKSSSLNANHYYALLLLCFPLFYIIGSLFLNIAIVAISLIYFFNYSKINYDKKIIFFFFLIFVYFLINSIFSENKFYSFYKSTAYFRYLFFIFGLLYLLLNINRNLLKSVSKLFIFLSILLVIDIAFEFFYGKDIFGNSGDYYNRISGPFGDELIVGFFLLYFGFSSWGLFLKSPRRWRTGGRWGPSSGARQSALGRPARTGTARPIQWRRSVLSSSFLFLGRGCDVLLDGEVEFTGKLLSVGFEDHVAFDLDEVVAFDKPASVLVMVTGLLILDFLSVGGLKEEFYFRFSDFELAVFHFEWSSVFNFHFVGHIGDLAGDDVQFGRVLCLCNGALVFILDPKINHLVAIKLHCFVAHPRVAFGDNFVGEAGVLLLALVGGSVGIEFLFD